MFDIKIFIQVSEMKKGKLIILVYDPRCSICLPCLSMKSKYSKYWSNVSYLFEFYQLLLNIL